MNRYLKYEFVRAVTIKSTFIFPLVGIALSWVLAYFGLHDFATVAYDENGNSVPSLVNAINNSYSPLSIFFITIPFAQAFGHDYRDGTMRLTLSAFPIRIKVFFAKLVIPTAVAALMTAISLVGIWVIYRLFIPSPDISNALQTMGRHIGFTIFWGLLVASVVIFTRIMAAGIAGIVVWAAILEGLLGVVLARRFPKLPDYLPISQGMAWAGEGKTRDLIVIATATVLMVGLAGIKFLKRDA